MATTVAACAASHALVPSWPLTAGIAVGGFLIDVDHALDYVLVERQRDLRPGAFLRYYLVGRYRRAVLVLHSYELFLLLGGLAWWTEALPLAGYLMGALMHLALDVLFNGALTPNSIAAFYSFAYRVAHGFEAATLLGTAPRQTPPQFWPAFFVGAQPIDAPTRAIPADGSELAG